MASVKAVYVIRKVGEKSYWTRIGVAFVNRDGSLSAKLDALPVDGELHIRDQEPREERPADAPKPSRGTRGAR